MQVEKETEHEPQESPKETEETEESHHTETTEKRHDLDAKWYEEINIEMQNGPVPPIPEKINMTENSTVQPILDPLLSNL